MISFAHLQDDLPLTYKQLETRGCVLSTVAIDATLGRDSM